MPDEEHEYKSIDEIRSTFYPGSVAMLNLEKEEVLSFPAGLTKPKVSESVTKHVAESETEKDSAD